ncbi:hypothetical protein [Saccharopolyspora pogona]|uniref:hypothetical protein n=1 Tax=Saccharopolyspora pogona TaxID=333966 RepID=UPI001685E631|nr:hypothetical protein [Saccharopolyspora pogona]
MRTPEHPLETLYQAREALQAAVSAVEKQTPAQVSDDLGCYGVVNHSILYECRSLVHALAEKVHDVSRPPVREAYGELREAITVFDQLIAIAQSNEPTINDLRRDARCAERNGRQPAVPRQPGTK